MSDEQELKPCPFCGGDGIIEYNTPDSVGRTDYNICCSDCYGSVCSPEAKTTRDNWNTRPIEDAKDARIAELEQQLAEAKRQNLQQRVEDMLMCDIDNQSHSMAVNIVSRLCSSKHGTFREATAHIQNILLHNQQRDMAITREKVYDWLIDQGVEDE